MALPPLTPRDALLLWQAVPVADAGLLAAAAAYLAGSRRVSHRHPARPWPAGRTASFLAGLLIVAVATQSSVAVYDDVLFTAHMVQHVLLIMVAPPLLVYGRPITLCLHAVRNPAHARVKRILRSPLARALTWPPGVTALYAVVVAVTHTPLVMDLVLRDPVAHAGEHLLYLAAGYLYFLPIVGSEPTGRRISYPARYLMLLLGMQIDTVVGLALLIQGRAIFPGYARAARHWGPTLLGDLHAGGVTMWAGSDVVMAALTVVLSVAFVHDRRRAGRLGAWIEGRRRRALLSDLAAAGLDPGGLRSRTIDDDAHLAAYNARLAAVSEGTRRRAADRLRDKADAPHGTSTDMGSQPARRRQYRSG